MDMICKGLALVKERPRFRNLLVAQLAAQAGDGLVQAALATVIVFGGQKGFDLEGARDPDEILRIALFIFVPYTVVSPFLGVVIDRWQRHRLLFVANGLRAVVVAGIALWGFTAGGFDDVPDVPLFGAFLLTLSSTRAVLATKSAALPGTLGDRSLVEGNAVSQLLGAIFQLGGAGVALLGKGIVGPEPIVMAGAIVYAVGAIFGARVRAERQRSRTSWSSEVARVLKNIAAGVREVSRNPRAGAAITTYFWLRCLWSFTLVGIGFVARELLADDDIVVAALTGGAGAVGAALGFLTADRLHARVRETARLVVMASLIAGAAVTVLGGLDLSVSLAALTFFLGFGFFLAKISLDTMVQEALGDDFRGRAFSLYDIAYNLAWVLAAGIMKVTWPDDNEGGLLIAAGGAIFLVGVLALAAWFRGAGLLARPPQAQPAR